MSEAKTYLSSFSSWLYPSRCALCDLLGDRPICDSCMGDFVSVDQLREEHDRASSLTLRANLYRYDGRTAQAIKRLKYSRATVLAAPLSKLMKEGIDRLGLTQYDLILPVPIHWSRRCVRGFNQAELLCENLEWTPKILTRVKRTRQQAGLSREDRATNLVGAFKVSVRVKGQTVLLVDDMLTSGHTVRECAKTLRDAGAAEVAAIAFAGEAW